MVCKTPNEFDDIMLNSDGQYLTGLWFINSIDIFEKETSCKEKKLPIFVETCKWLDICFSGKDPGFEPKYKINNSTLFRNMVIDIINKIPFRKTITYSDISKEIVQIRGIEKMSSQAVGGAVGWNPICIIIPCHRVVGKNGSLTGYGGGMSNKVALLKLENNDMANFIIPKK